jgi:hypothetical protein
MLRASFSMRFDDRALCRLGVRQILQRIGSFAACPGFQRVADVEHQPRPLAQAMSLFEGGERVLVAASA